MDAVGHVSVLEAKTCGAETVPELVTSPHTTLPVDTPPLVAVKVQSRLSQRSGPAEAVPVMVSVAPVTAPVAAKLAAVAAPVQAQQAHAGRPLSASCPTRRRWTSAWLRRRCLRLSDDFFLTKNCAGWSKLQVQQQRGLRQRPGAAAVAGALALFDSVEAKQYKRPDMNGDLRMGFASDDFAGTKWKNLTGTARWSDGTEMVTLDSSLTSPACSGGCAGLPGWELEAWQAQRGPKNK